MSKVDGNIGLGPSKRPLVVDPSFAAWAEKHRVFELLEGMTKDLIITQPEDPLEHMLAYLKQKPVHRVFVHGPIGSGRKALCNAINEKTNAIHLEVNAVVRAAVEQETKLGEEAKPFVDAGDPVPNKILVPLVLTRLAEGDCKRNGFVMRGFPKNRAQAAAMQMHGLLPTHVFVLTGSTEDSAIAYQQTAMAEGTISSAAKTLDIVDSLEEFRLNLSSYLSSFPTVAVKLDATQTPEKVFQEAWIRLCTEKQSKAPFIPRVALLGARGSGIREQADRLAKKYGAIAVHYQEVLQKAADVGDAVSRNILSSRKTGKPVPDSVLHSLIAKEISQLSCQTQGWILSGYPQTALQAQALMDAQIVPNRTFVLSSTKDTVIERLSGRRLDRVSGQSSHNLFNPSKEDSSRLAQHPADTESSLERGFDQFQSELDGLKGVFTDHVEIDANSDGDTTFGYIDGSLVRPRHAAAYPGP